MEVPAGQIDLLWWCVPSKSQHCRSETLGTRTGLTGTWATELGAAEAGEEKITVEPPPQLSIFLGDTKQLPVSSWHVIFGTKLG